VSGSSRPRSRHRQVPKTNGDRSYAGGKPPEASRLVITALVVVGALAIALVMLPAGSSGKLRDNHLREAGSQGRTAVSLMFDGGWADQYRYGFPALRSHGMSGIFYVSSRDVGRSCCMTWGQLHQLAAAGNVIGGRGIDDVDLTDAEATYDYRVHEVCDDRDIFVLHGFDPVAFAYPLGRFDGELRSILESCGYSSGRPMGGLSSEGQWAAERTPVADAFAIKTLGPSSNMTVSEVERTIRRASSRGGGWVPVVFTRVCHSAVPSFLACMSTRGAISDVSLNTLLGWLKDAGRRDESGALAGAPAGTVVGELPSGLRPPRKSSYFHLRPPGSWLRLPGDKACSRRIRRSSWEPRPENERSNHTMPDPHQVRLALRARPRAVQGAYAHRWDSWLLRRVDGHFMGTTDEIFQWAACKWGLNDNMLRAIGVIESSWYQDARYSGGACVQHWGCGDITDPRDRVARAFCNMEARRGHDYQADFGTGRCPRTFSIVGVMSWHPPQWGRNAGNQNGTFPFNRDSTAFALDYLGAHLRGCLEGWEKWLDNTGTDYRKGDIAGCVGSWYAGAWHTSAADEYFARVTQLMRTRPWLDPSWSEVQPPCDRFFGCPQLPSRSEDRI
jgi:hypothetical protein